MNDGGFLGIFSFFATDSWERFVVVEIVGGPDMLFNFILWWVAELDECMGGFFLEGCSVRYEDGINIMAVESISFFDLGDGEDGVLNALVDVGSGLIFFRLFYYY